MAPRTLGWTAIVALALACALAIDVAGVIVPTLTRSHYVGDFTVFWAAARSNVPYNANELTLGQSWITGSLDPRPFAYPPTFLAFIRPLGWFPHWWAFSGWVAIGMCAYFIAARRIFSLPVVMLSLVSPSVIVCLFSGQSTLIVSALIIGAISMLATRPIAAGILFGLVGTLKPQSVLLVPLALAAAGHWRALSTAVVTGLLVTFVTLAIQGPQLWLDWLGSLAGFKRAVEQIGLPAKSATPIGLAIWLGLGEAQSLVLRMACGLIGCVTVAKVFRSTDSKAARLAAIVAGGLLCSPYAMPYELATFQPAACAMLLDRKAHPATWLTSLLCVTTLAAPLAVLLMATTLLWRTLSSPSFTGRQLSVA